MIWIPKRQYSPEERDSLQRALNIHPLFIQLLLQRGIDNFEDAKSFFRPNPNALHNPYRMKDMEKAVTRIQTAIKNKENILVYGDYDVDGTTAVSMMYEFIHKELKHENVSFYIPDRYSEGYGVSQKGIDFAVDNACGLIITLDCGIKSFDKILYANTHNIDVIVCDHHIPDENLPPAHAILNPKQALCNYPFKELSGCGVGFKLIQALTESYGINESVAWNYVDLVAISTCADIVPLVDENRILVHHGIKKINANPRKGFLELLKRAGAEGKELNVEDAVFILGPRINAAGRIAHASKVVELLTGESTQLQEELSHAINTHNSERQEIDKTMTAEALQMIAQDPEHANKSTNVLYNPNWHKGVVGIVASRVIESYYRPTLILTLSNGKITGSGRSIAGFDLYDALMDCDEYLTNWGGHAHAAGLTLEPEMLAPFADAFDKAVAKRLKPDQLIPTIHFDADVHPAVFNSSFLTLLKQFAPFGPANPAPLFLLKNLKIYNQNLRLLKDEHLQLQFYAADDIEQVYSAIGFKLGKHFNALKKASAFNAICALKENHFNGQTHLQFEIKDVEPI